MDTCRTALEPLQYGAFVTVTVPRVTVGPPALTRRTSRTKIAVAVIVSFNSARGRRFILLFLDYDPTYPTILAGRGSGDSGGGDGAGAQAHPGRAL